MNKGTGMDIRQYQDAVIALFKSGAATDEQWQEMAGICLHASEDDCQNIPSIDKAIYGACELCGECLYGEECRHSSPECGIPAQA